MTAKISGAQFQFIEDAGHWPQWEQTDAFDDLMLRFLEGHLG